jgi:quercetin dioxygenase-like cupin family protein
MPDTLFIDTNKLPRQHTPQGDFTEILNNQLAGAKNVLGVLRWLAPGQKFKADAGNKYQLLYLMEGQGNISLENKDHEVKKGMGIYLGPSETATLQAAPGSTVKIFHLTVPQIPK